MSDEKDASVVQAFTSAGGDDKSCLRLFARGGSTPGCYVLGSWAAFIAREYIKSTAVLKSWGGLDVVAVNDTMAKEVIRDCLLRRGVSVEFHERPAGGGAYACVQRGSPGHIADFEATLFSFEESEIQLLATGVLVLGARAGGDGVRVGFAALNTTLRTLTYAEYVDTPQLSSLDALMAQCNLKELAYHSGRGATGEEDPVRAARQLCGRANITFREAGKERPSTHQREEAAAATAPSSQAAASGAPSLAALQDVLRVPEEQVALLGCELAARAMEHLLAAMVDPFDPANHRAFYLKHTVPATFVKLDAAAIEALHLIHHKPEVRGSLPTSIYSWLNRCVTGMGARMMRQWLLQPLRNVDDINQRLSLVETMVESPILRDAFISQVLRGCSDMDRLNRKLQRRTVALKDIQAIFSFANIIPRAIQVLRSHQGRDSKLLFDEFVAPMEDINEHLCNLRTLIGATIDSSDNNSARINPEFDDELTTLEEQRTAVVKSIDKEYHRTMKRYEWNERQLKCEYHSSYGYVFRVSRKEDEQLRKSKELITIATAKDGVRFVSEQLASLSEQYKGIRRDYDTRQLDLKRKLVETVATYLPVLDDAKELIAALDVFVAWALVVKDAPRPMVRPNVRPPSENKSNKNMNIHHDGSDGVGGSGNDNEEEMATRDVLTIVNARHPLVEMRQPNYTPNTVRLSEDANALIVTGPNMGGKSTFMRSIGICVVLAQCGCFVPADSADIIARDAVMCRVGATDHLAQGVSTFMVEMLESAAILTSATRESLAIIDELGRGTSTYDGFGLAWAIAEEVAVKVKSTLLFSTHFHEMTQLPEKHINVRNVHFGADVNAAEGTLRFSYKLEPGPCGRSYGLYVAQLANMPEEVVQAAKSKAAELEDFEQDEWRKRANQALAQSPELAQKVTEYGKRLRELGSTNESMVSNEALQKLRLEVQQDPLLVSLLGA